MSFKLTILWARDVSGNEKNVIILRHVALLISNV